MLNLLAARPRISAWHLVVALVSGWLVCPGLWGADSPEPPARHPTRILARFRDTPTSATPASASALASAGVRVSRHISLVPGLVVLEEAPTTRAASVGMASVSSPDLQQRIAALRRTGLFSYVEPDYQVSISALPTDARFTDGTLWGLQNMGQNGGTAGIDIDAVRAWQITTGSRDVIVAVVDTGIDYTHTELRDQMWRNPGEIPGNGVDDDANGFVDDVFGINAIDPTHPPYDDHDHGTHVAGTIGAAANDGFPHVGVAWQVQLMACKFLSAQGYGYNSDAVTCIDYATRHGASIINASWGGGEYTQALVDSIAAAGEAGVLFVAAAGNSGLDLQSELGERYPAYPAGYNLDTILSVAAIDRRGEMTSFSNFGRFSVDLGAPGDEVFSSVARLGKNGYGTFRGTSMAAPHAAGVAALARARHPDLTARELKALLLHTATPTPSLIDRTVTGSRVNAYTAVSSSADGRLELSLLLPDSHIAFSGRALRIAAYVTDLHERTGASVAGEANGVPLDFRDDGVAPDEHADDALYTAWATPVAGTSTLTVSAHAELSGYTPASAELDVTVLNPPENDAFAAATLITASAASLPGSTTGASAEPGEPHHAGLPGGASVWWKWTAPMDVAVNLKIPAATVDTIVAVYTGSELSALTEVAAEEATPSPLHQSLASFHAQAGMTYYIAVDAWEGASGDFVLEFVARIPAPNDAFADAVPLTGESFRVVGTTIGSTTEPGEPPNDFFRGGSVWHTWTAPRSGVATIEVSGGQGGYDGCEVFTGTSLSTLHAQRNLAWSILHAVWDTYRFQVVEGETYDITVRPVAEPSGYFILTLAMENNSPNDAFANRTPLSGDDVTVLVDNRGAAPEPMEPELWDDSIASDMPVASVWYSWTAPRDGTAWVYIPFNNFFSTLAAYTGDRLDALTRVGLGYQSYVILFTPFYGNHMTFPVRRSETYSIMVGGVEGTIGVSTLRIQLLTPPLNMWPADAIQLSGTALDIASSNLGATNSLWWTWTAPANGAFAVDVSSTDFDPIVSVFERTYDGTPLPIEQRVFDPNRFVINATKGTTYILRVDTDPNGRNLPGLTGIDGLHGSFHMSLLLDAAPQDTPVRPGVITGAPINTRASNRACAPRNYDYGLGTESLHAPLWWLWTASASESVVISTAGTDLDTILGVFSSDAFWPATRLAFNDNAKPGQIHSEVVLDVQAGATYLILVDTRAATGTIPLSIRRRTVLANDAFIQSAPLDSASPIASGSNLDATAESSEPRHAFLEAERSVWWTWTAPESGLYSASTAGSTFDTTVGVYTGDSVGALRWIAGNDDGPGPDQTSLAVFRAVAGVSYHIAVDGYRGATGSVSLSVVPFDRPSISLLVPFRPMPAGEPLRLLADVRGRGPYSFQWYRNGVAIAGATDMSLTIPLLQRFHAGAYSLVVTGPSGPTTAGPFSIEVAESPASTASVVNLSTRALCRGGDDVLIPGFVLSGAGTRRILMRAIGPELLPLGVGNPLVDPAFVVMRRDSGGHVEIGNNDDWADDDAVAIDTLTQQVHAFPLEPSSTSSALVMDLPAGTYTVIAQGHPGQSGIALVELYDAGATDSSFPDAAHVTNLSNRGYAGDGEDVMIPGFVIEGSGTRTFLLRAVGPGLASLGVVGALADPTLSVFRHENDSAQLVLQNDSWGEFGDASAIEAASAASGAFALESGSRDAAMIVTLPPGVYTAHARGASGTSGIVLVELYLLP